MEQSNYFIWHSWKTNLLSYNLYQAIVCLHSFELPVQPYEIIALLRRMEMCIMLLNIDRCVYIFAGE